MNRRRHPQESFEAYRKSQNAQELQDRIRIKYGVRYLCKLDPAKTRKRSLSR
jgi:hypothetical protein